MLVFGKMMMLFAYMMVGFLSAKKGLLKKDFYSGLSTFIVMIGNPALIVSSVMGKYERPQWEVLIKTMIIAVIMFLVLILISQIIPHLFSVNKDEKGIYKTMMVFSNIGFMGFPVILSLYGKEGLLMASLFLLPYNILIYTYGIAMIQDKDDEYRFTWKKIINPGVAACILTMIIFGFNITFPEPVVNFVETIGNMTAPLSMIFIGGSMLGISFKSVMKNKKIFIFLIIKLVIIPIIAIGILQLYISDKMITGVLLVMLGMPVGSMTVMLAKEYGGKVETASEGVIISTLMSVLTLPILFMIF